MSATIFYVGGAEFATLTDTFTNALGALVDPTTVTLVVTDPQGVSTTYTLAGATVTRLSLGVYQVLVPCITNPGLWQYVWIGTGSGSDIDQGTWRVFPLTAGQWYTSLEEVKSRLGITDTSDDLEVQLAVQAAARAVEGRCGRHFYQLSETRTYVPRDIWTAYVDDMVSVTQLAVDQSGSGSFSQLWTQGTDYELALAEWNYNQNSSGEPRPYRVIRVIGGGAKFFPFVFPLYRLDRIQIQGVFGWPQVPNAVAQATALLAVDLFKLKDAPFGVQGFAEFGIQTVKPGSQIDALLQPYIDSTRKVGV